METKGLNNRKRPRVSTHEEPLRLRLQSILCGQEAGAVALLIIPPTSSRTLWPVHDAWAAALHMVEEMLRRLVKLAIAAAPEEGYPQMLPRMTIGMSGGMTAINGQSPWVLKSEPKPDTCLVTPALTYKGSHSSSNLKSLGLHLARQPSLLRWLIQYSPMTVGG